MEDLSAEWQRKGATLSDKTAQKEFGLTQDEIIHAIRTDMLQHRVNSMHGNPFLRLLRSEVEALVKGKHGRDFLKDMQAKAELSRIDRDLKRLRAEIKKLEQRKGRRIGELGT